MIPSELVREILRCDVSEKPLKLYLAALEDRGPRRREDWAFLIGSDAAHFKRVFSVAVKGGRESCNMIEAKETPEGLILIPLQPSLWNVHRRSADACDRAWAKPSAPTPLDLVTEMPSLAEVMAGGDATTILVSHQNGGRHPTPLYSRSSVLEKKIDPDRVEKAGPVARLARSGGDREWLLAKLKRLPRVEQEIMKPQDGDQQRMGRLFWEAEESDTEWLKGILGDLVDRTDISNKAAWLNRSLTSRLKASHPSHKAAGGIGTGPSQRTGFG